MPRLRRKTSHEPDRAASARVAPEAAPRPALDRYRFRTPRSLAIALNGGRPRPKPLDIDPAMFDDLSQPMLPVAPFRERVAARAGRAELLVFGVGQELFATELCAVEEAVEGVAVRAVPDAPPAMLGIFALRDRTLPMYVLARVLDVPHTHTGAMTLVMRNSEARVALAVDAVDDVYDAPLEGVRAVPGGGDGEGIALGIVWRGAELVTLLDADLLVAACLAVSPPDVP